MQSPETPLYSVRETGVRFMAENGRAHIQAPKVVLLPAGSVEYPRLERAPARTADAVTRPYQRSPPEARVTGCAAPMRVLQRGRWVLSRRLSLRFFR